MDKNENGDMIVGSDPILLQEGVKDVVRNYQSQVAELQKELNIYMAGMRAQANVPKDWLLDFEKMAFIPGEHKEKGGRKVEEN